MSLMSDCTHSLTPSLVEQGGPSESILNASQQVADKYQDVLTLESSMTQLHEMFVDFALLTEQQGEMLDQIEFQVKSASDFIEDANIDMVQVRTHTLTHIHIHIHTHIHTYRYTQIHTDTHRYTHTPHTYIHIDTHTYIHH
jgi:alkylated DNA repair dioxygenase AlkB